jgi:hypothetical protein
MERRIYLTGLATASATLISGCSGDSGSDSSDSGSGDSGGGGGGNVVVSGSTNYENTWDVDLEEGDELELELTLEDGFYALGNVSRNDNADDVATLDTEEQTTLTEQLTVPETVDYFVVLQVSAEESRTGSASLTLRHTNE